MTIEERAKQLMDTLPCDEPKGLVYEAYKVGATDQKAIDIDNAVKWVDENVGTLTAIALRKAMGE